MFMARSLRKSLALNVAQSILRNGIPKQGNVLNVKEKWRELDWS